ncbi:WD_REPEATS_REGION domain-containing protein [Psidium guajava]|nr:WD_REPEATS_REGION domain-containing protein [Psidium guajava]
MKTSLSPSPSAIMPPPDLELPKIRVPSSSVAAAVDDGATNGGDAGAIQITASDDDSQCCRTPTSSEHRIQAAASCPAAPRKPRAAPSRRKRRREFFEVANQDEVEGFFRSYELALRLRDGPRGAAVKRRFLSKGVVVAIL